MRVCILLGRRGIREFRCCLLVERGWLLIVACRLKPLDIEIMKRLGTRVNLIPVVAKADTLTQNDLATFKQRVRPRHTRP